MSINITIIIRAPPFTTSDPPTSQCCELEGVLVSAAIGQVTRGFLGRFLSSLDQMGGDFMDFCEVELWSLENPKPSQDFSVESLGWIGWTSTFIHRFATLDGRGTLLKMAPCWLRFCSEEDGSKFQLWRSEDTMKAVDMPRRHVKFTRGYQMHHRAQVFSRSEGSHKNPVGIYLRMLDEAWFVVKDVFIQIIRMILDYRLQTEVHIFMMNPLLVFSPIFYSKL